MSERKNNEADYTSKGLPVISEAVFESLVANHANNNTWGSHLEEVKERVMIENPYLAAYIESQLRRYPEEMQIPIAETVMGVLTFLEQQATTNKLARNFKTAEEPGEEKGLFHRFFKRR